MLVVKVVVGGSQLWLYVVISRLKKEGGRDRDMTRQAKVVSEGEVKPNSINKESKFASSFTVRAKMTYRECNLQGRTLIDWSITLLKSNDSHSLISPIYTILHTSLPCNPLLSIIFPPLLIPELSILVSTISILLKLGNLLLKSAI